jgi:urease accessory protein
MADGAALLASLQLGDSALPIGRFAHSHGLESLLRSEPELARTELEELLETVIADAVAPLDGAAVARAHDLAALGDPDLLPALDRRVTARKLTPAGRRASTTCGRNLAALVPAFTDREPVTAHAARVRAGECDGNLAVLEGALAHALDVPRLDAVLLELRGVAASFLSAAVRLGCLTASEAQASLHRLAPVLVESAREADTLPADSLRSVAPELDVYLAAHERLDGRLFAS